MTEMDVERCLTMSAYAALRALRSYLEINPSSSVASAVEVLRRTNSDFAELDYLAALTLHECFPLGVPRDHRGALRFLIREIIRFGRPWWLRLAPYGSEKLRSALDEDQSQCFRDAGLFDLIPDTETVAWWDELASFVRGYAEAERVSQGREAERLSFERERKRLKELGISEEPAWVALADSTLGYDIKSFDLVGGVVVNMLIEVKSAMSGVIFVTRNEWNNALSAGDRYVFHVWRMPDEQLIEIWPKGIDPHIPSDHGSGVWQDVKITV